MAKKSFLSTLIIFSLILGLAFSTTSCKKYEEGPTVSLRSKKARITNTWKINEMYINGEREPLDEADNSMRWIFERDRRFTMKIGDEASKGIWDFNEDKDEIRIMVSEGEESFVQTYKIIKLTSKELGLEMSFPDFGGKEYKIKMYLIPA